MTIRKFLFYLSLIILLTSISLLISGSNILSKPVFNTTIFAYGSLITWLSLIALPMLIYTGFNKLYSPKSKKEKLIVLLLS